MFSIIGGITCPNLDFVGGGEVGVFLEGSRAS